MILKNLKPSSQHIVGTIKQFKEHKLMHENLLQNVFGKESLNPPPTKKYFLYLGTIKYYKELGNEAKLGNV